MNKVLQEMNEIFGGQFEQPKIDPTQPRDVAGTFIVQGVTAIDEAILNSIAELTWEQIADIAVLATIGPTDFHILAAAVNEGVSAFRRAWSDLTEDKGIAEGVNRGAFMLLSKACVQESYTRYVYWCLNMLGEANEAIVNSIAEKAPAVKMVIPDGQTMAQRDRDVDNAMKYMGREFIEPYERADKKEYMDKKLNQIKDIEKSLETAAGKMGKEPDEAFLNTFMDLDRERARNS